MSVLDNLTTVSDIKCVKSSVVLKSGEFVKVIHYGTTILELDLSSKKVVSINRASMTSSKMINRVLDYYGFDRSY